MTYSIVDQLARWLATNREKLLQKGIGITDRLPRESSDVPWKGSIGLVKGDILVSYTVWERTGYQAELIIVDGKSGKTLRSEDAVPQHPKEINAVLDAVVGELIAGT